MQYRRRILGGVCPVKDNLFGRHEKCSFFEPGPRPPRLGARLPGGRQGKSPAATCPTQPKSIVALGPHMYAMLCRQMRELTPGDGCRASRYEMIETDLME